MNLQHLRFFAALARERHLAAAAAALSVSLQGAVRLAAIRWGRWRGPGWLRSGISSRRKGSLDSFRL